MVALFTNDPVRVITGILGVLKAGAVFAVGQDRAANAHGDAGLARASIFRRDRLGIPRPIPDIHPKDA